MPGRLITKSYSLQSVESIEGAVATLREILPGQVSPWLLLSSDGDPIAYFDVRPGDVDAAGPSVVVDVSGRHYDDDEKVLAILRKLQQSIGGNIVSDT